MTREELKAHCIRQVEQCERWAELKGEEPSGKMYEEHKLILELLDQAPCEDAISRQAVLDLINTDWKYEGLEIEISNLPSVIPQPKTGRWIDRWDKIFLCENKDCSICGYTAQTRYNFCPNCGAKMIESEE